MKLPVFCNNVDGKICNNPDGDFCDCINRRMQEARKQTRREINNPIMTYGKYKDIYVKDIPKSYLIWMYEQDKLNGRVKMWVEKNYIN